MRTSNALQIGKAGEYLVCADLILKGFVAFPSEQGLPYDVLLDNGSTLYKVQVKTTSEPRVIPQRAKDFKAYIFNIKRHGSGGSQRYGNDEVDIFALVCLDTRRVGYLRNADMPETINLRVDALRGTYRDEKGLSDYYKIMELKNSMTQTAIAQKLGISVSLVNRYCKPDFEPFTTSAKYFSDIERDSDWFLH